MKEELRIHSFIHFDGVIHTCLDCHQIFKKRKLLNNHMKKHETASFQCKMCQQMFKYRSNLGKHQKEGRCKGPAQEATESAQSPEVEAEIAKRQLIDMTVNSARFVRPDCVKAEIKEEIFEIFSITDVEEVKMEATEFEFQTPAGSVKIETEVKAALVHPTKRIYRKKKQRKVLKRQTAYACDLCGFAADKKCKILSHIRHHVASRRHKCKTCSDSFTTRIKLHNHSMKAHGRGVIGSVEYSKAPATCEICQQVFSDERLKFHMKLHESPSFSCDKCAKMFRNQSALEKHFASSHFTDKRFTCTTCGKSFKKLTILKQHEEIHNPFKIYVQCDVCLSVMQIKSLKLHMEVKHGDRYKDKKHVCECGKAFRYLKQLEKHHEAVHLKVNRGIIYPCPECDLAFNRRLELREHSFDHYAGKIFVCECGMKFKKRKLLSIHMMVHKNDRWQCEFCPLSFQTRGGRRKHYYKIHGQVVDEVLEIPSIC